MLEGETDFTVLTVGTPVRVTVHAGRVLVVPRGAWHRRLAREAVTLLSATPTRGDPANRDVRWLAAIVALALSVIGASAAAQDDHPLVSRDEGSTVVDKKSFEFGEYRLVTGRTSRGELVAR